MRVARLILGLTVGLTMALTGLAPASQAYMGIGDELHAGLHHSRAYPYATGGSDYMSYGSTREVHVGVHHIARLAGHRVIVYVNYKKVGTMYVNRYGNAYREWRTSWGQYVPYCMSGGPVRIRTASGTLVASGWYSQMNHH